MVKSIWNAGKHGKDVDMDIKVKEEFVKQALKLHQENPVADAHLDLAGEILLRNMAGEKDVVKNHYLPHFRTAGMNLVLSSVYVENGNLDKAWDNALCQINALKEDVEGLEDVLLIKSKVDLDKALKEDKIGIIIYMEGLDCIGEDIDKLDMLYEMGIRGASLTWSRANALATGCCVASEHRQIPGGLTDAGIKAVKKMEELSMFLDVSHLNDEGFEQLCRITEKSFIATHSGSRRIYDNYRNLTDEQMGALAFQDGIMGMNGCVFLTGSFEGNHLEMLCRHIEYEVEKIGAAHVGYGFDLCDSYDFAKAALSGKKPEKKYDCLLNHSQVPLLSAALLQRGMSSEDVKCIMGGNFINFFKKCL